MTPEKKTHERIWLQAYGEFDDTEGVTWCEDKINDNDIEYVLASKLKAAQVELAEAKENEAKLHQELEEKNYACGDVLDKLWKEYVADDESYGDWEYPGQVYRHIKAVLEDAQVKTSVG